MGVILGLDGKMYRNTTPAGPPTWNEVGNVKDLSLNLEKGEADVTTRANAGWRATKGTLKEGTIEFQMVYDTEDDDFTAFQTAYFSNAAVEVAIMDGPIATAGSEGLRATCDVTTFSMTENLEEPFLVNVTLKPTYAATPPAWVTAPISALEAEAASPAAKGKQPVGAT